ncbi:CheR family methyltransferase [Egicoccus halophilus]|uniref:Chemotaxis protein R n=1 Tax=Egicoccus halophilus TaxID=1670830 RepID=A0A8J3ET60_9ACTN|nr:protein-glutamate O-methyltransferase CheR [Egicoccus halophilus]GGI04539.1 chemotaxis protein R [Egicoccus halophilus]
MSGPAGPVDPADGAGPPPVATADVEDVELDVLLEAIQRVYGYDFRNYARASLRRRLWRRVTAEGRSSLSGLLEEVLHDPGAMERLRVDLSVTVTSMFRDPPFFLALREQVVPLLATYPFVRIWVAGCASGEEVYSLAILLREEGLGDRVRIYATDVSDEILERARAGRVPLDKMRTYSSNYLAGGGRDGLSRYYEVEGRWARMDPSLRDGVVFARHNLATDGTFNEFHLILCRNVLIYFDRILQQRVHQLFDDSLVPLGLLALGARESLVGSHLQATYETVDAEVRIYRRSGT